MAQLIREIELELQIECFFPIDVVPRRNHQSQNETKSRHGGVLHVGGGGGGGYSE